MNRSTPGPLSITNSRSPPKPMSIESVMPSNHLILCRPLLLPSIFPSIRVFSNESALCKHTHAQTFTRHNMHTHTHTHTCSTCITCTNTSIHEHTHAPTVAGQGWTPYGQPHSLCGGSGYDSDILHPGPQTPWSPTLATHTLSSQEFPRSLQQTPGSRSVYFPMPL